MRRAPLRAFERPIIFAARSMRCACVEYCSPEIQWTYLVSAQITYGSHHHELAPFLRLFEGPKVA